MKKNKKIQYYIEYIALKAIISFLHLFSMDTAKKIGFFLADFVFIFVPIRKKHIIDSLTKSFPEKSKEEIKKIAKDVYKQFVCTVVEIIFVSKMTDEQIKNFVNFQNLYLIEEAMKNGRGGVIMSAHFGNWEMLALSFSKRYPLSVIVAKQENPYFDKVINSIRSTKGYKTIYKEVAPIGVLRALKRKEFVAILADQHAGDQGVYTPFFYREVSTPKGPAVFALRAKCPLYTGFCARQPDGRYVVTFEEIPLPDTGDEEKKVEEIMTEYNRILQRHIEKNPSFWFWFHRRWKSQKPKINVVN
ncbi:MAG: lysophospholipid acyltransferase family protein [Elusimicrobia bacterium]|nr:lysophospholipid acyltransferase family protein [Elusimicrobiota bacterium]